MCKEKHPVRGKNSTYPNDNIAVFFEEVLSQNGWHNFGSGIRWLARGEKSRYGERHAPNPRVARLTTR